MTHRVNLTKNGAYWLARWRDDEGNPRSKSLGNRKHVTKSEAKARVLDLEQTFVGNPRARGSRKSPHLSVWFERYCELRKGDLDPRTITLHRKTVAYLTEWAQDVRLDQITPERAEDFPAFIRHKDLSPETVSLHTRNARVIFEWARRRRLVASNPFADVKVQGAGGVRRFHYVSLTDLDKILAECPDDRWRAMFSLCRRAGLRFGEAWRLRWADVNWTEGTLAIHPEDDRETTKQRYRVVPMDPDLARMMLECHERATEGRAAMLSQNNVFRQATAIIKRAGLPAYSKPFHALRKSLETDWLGRYPVMTVCKMLGHAPTVAAKHYHQVHDSEIKAITGGVDPVAALTKRMAELEEENAKLRESVKTAQNPVPS